jgi:23S rRNA (cytidine1920-2'-O)/16S rRNA (cytidine1409-2'-O)-methyltransferase
MPKKQRIDVLIFERGLAPSRAKAQAMIMAGEVLVDGNKIDKPGTKVNIEAKIIMKSKPRFVSRGGEKLAGALVDFSFDVTGRICADVGASTGGFTDCLLQNGVTRIYAIDVGYGQLDYKLRQDERVIVMERTNARYVDDLAEPVDFVVVDASFISLKILLPVIKGWLHPQADLITLIKPQFEAGKKDVGKGGVIRDAAIHSRVLEDTIEFMTAQGFTIAGLTRSPIKGPSGNIEFLSWLSWGSDLLNIDIPAKIQELVTLD